MFHGEKAGMITNENTPTLKEAPGSPSITIKEHSIWEYLLHS